MRAQMPLIGGRDVDPSEALAGLPAIAHQNATACGTDVLSYISESPVVDGAVHETYTTSWRRLEFIVALRPDRRPRAPKGRGKGVDDCPTWICGHEY